MKNPIVNAAVIRAVRRHIRHPHKSLGVGRNFPPRLLRPANGRITRQAVRYQFMLSEFVDLT
jgi:hypothetical protein